MTGILEFSTEMIFSRARSLTPAETWCKTLSRDASTHAIMSGSVNQCSWFLLNASIIRSQSIGSDG